MNQIPSKEPAKGFSLVRFWQELRRRHVVRVALVYAIAGWLVIQVANATFEDFGIPAWAYRFVVLMVLLGLPLSLIIAWAFELTPDGVTKTKTRPVDGDIGELSGQPRKSKWFSLVFAAAMPTVIFGSLAVFFYFQAGGTSKPVEEAEPLPPEQVQMASIAVLPLINMSHQEENEYFAGGVHEDILTNLSRIKTLSVVSRTTMLHYATSDLPISEIGEALDVDYIVEGSVRRIGNHVRVTIQLNHAREDRHLWANNFEREVLDEFATQSELAKVISSSLHLEVQPETVGQLSNLPTSSVKAYDLYLSALNLEKTTLRSPQQLMQIRDLLAGAVQEDPDFVEAWAFLKRNCDHLLNQTYGINSATQSAFAEIVTDMEMFRTDLQNQSARALAKAVALAPTHVETLLAKAVTHKWPQPANVLAEQRSLFDRILAKDPDFAKAWYHLGWWYRKIPEPDIASSDAAFAKAIEYDPFNARIVRSVLDLHRRDGNQESVTELNERLIHIIPETAEDRRLARIQTPRIPSYFRKLKETGDETHIAQLEVDMHEKRAAFSSERDWDWGMASLAFLKNDKAQVISRVENYPVEDFLTWEWENGVNIPRLDMFLDAFYLHLDNERMEEANEMAQRLIKASQRDDLRHYFQESPMYLSGLIIAHHFFGDKAEADRLLQQLKAMSNEDSERYYRVALSRINLEQVVEEELTVLKEWENKNFENRSFGYCDNFAMEYIRNGHLLSHPDIVEFYVEQEKWLPYLSKRLPAYAQYATE